MAMLVAANKRIRPVESAEADRWLQYPVDERRTVTTPSVPRPVAGPPHY